MNQSTLLRKAAGTILLASMMALASTDASALCFTAFPTIGSTVTGSGNSYAYAYSVGATYGSCIAYYGSAPYVIEAFELPYFSDAGITDIQSPTGWSAAVVDVDAFGLGNGAQTLVWTAASGYEIQPFGGDWVDEGVPSLAGFGYTAGYNSAESPSGVQVPASQTLWVIDPALPASPSAIAAGLQAADFPPLSAAPEPSSALALLAGLAFLATRRRSVA